jgi:hypothetical protein
VSAAEATAAADGVVVGSGGAAVGAGVGEGELGSGLLQAVKPKNGTTIAPPPIQVRSRRRLPFGWNCFVTCHPEYALFEAILHKLMPILD